MPAGENEINTEPGRPAHGKFAWIQYKVYIHVEPPIHKKNQTKNRPWLKEYSEISSPLEKYTEL